MNATTTNLNPVNSAQSPSAAGKQQAVAAPDVPFNQVLASEIAQNKSSAKAQEDSRAAADSDAASAPADSTETDATPATEATETETSSRDPLQLPGAETSPQLTQNLPGMPDPLLALAIKLDLLKLAPAGTDSTLSENAAAVGANTPPLFEPGNGAARPAWLVGQATDETAGAKKIDASLTGKAGFQAAIANSAPHVAAAAFAGQMAAARQSDAMKAGERLPDLISNPALTATPQPLLHVDATLTSVVTNSLAPSVGTTAWNQALGDKIVWMAAGAQQTASLTLNPPNLGPLQIVLNLTNDQATASFFTAQPEVRQALEAAFPRLREMLNEAGIQLGQATVSADTSRQNDTPERQAQRIATPFAGTDDAASSHSAPLPIRQSGRGLVDTFA